MRLATPLCCAFNRHYVSPQMDGLLQDLGADARLGSRIWWRLWGWWGEKIRFQRYHAARHDDHIHIEL